MSTAKYPGARPPAAVAWLALFLLALAVRIGYDRLTPTPLSADALYHYMVAGNLATGRGMVADYLWQYLGGLPASLPAPAYDYWMPMPAWVEAGAFRVLGVSEWAAKLPSMLLGAGLALFTALLAWEFFRRRSAWLLAGLMAALSYHLVSLSVPPDVFMLTALFTGASLFAIYRGRSGSAAWAVLAGGSAGLAYLTRSDGLLLLVVFGLLAGWDRWRTRSAAPLYRLGLGTAAFAAVAGPWALFVPRTTGLLRTAFLTSYNDIFRLDQSRLTLSDYLSTNQSVAWMFKGWVLYRELRWLALAIGVAGVLAVYELIRGRRWAQCAPWLIHLGMVSLLLALVFPFPTMKGSFWHLLPSLTPLFLALGAGGAIRLQELRGRIRLAAWLAPALALGYCLAWYPFDLAHSTSQGYPYPAEVAAALRNCGARAVLSDNIWVIHHLTGLPGAQLPTDGAGAVLAVADRLGATHLVVLERSRREQPAVRRLERCARFIPQLRGGRGEREFVVCAIMPAAQAERQAKQANREGIALATAGRPGRALSWFQQADSLKPDFPPILSNLALAYWQIGDRGNAFVCAERTLDLRPKDRNALKIVEASKKL